MPINVNYAGGAVQAVVSGAFTPTVPGAGGTFSVDDATGYPVSGQFPVKINRGLSDEEHILVSSRSGTTFTVGQRGYDGTTAQTHAAGASCEIYFDAQSANLIVQHVDDVEADPHSTKLLNNTRHDVTARHPAGSVIPTAAAGAIQPDDTAAEGASGSLARADHRHAITAAAPGTIAPDDTATEGVATTFARSDHRHAITTATPSQIGTFLTEGGAAFFARSDHIHELGPGAVDTTDRIVDGIVTFAKLAAPAVSTWAVSFDGVTLGGGSTFSAYYKIGRMVLGVAGFELGASGNVTGTIAVNTPTAITDLTGGLYAGAQTGNFCVMQGHDAGSSVWAALGAVNSATARLGNFRTTGTNAVYNATTPFNWGPGDHAEVFFLYWAPS